MGTIGIISQISSVSFWVGEQSLFSEAGQNLASDLVNHPPLLIVSHGNHPHHLPTQIGFSPES
jgi:hypothetical protein